MLKWLAGFFPAFFNSSDKKVEEHIVFTLMAIAGFLYLSWYDLSHLIGSHFDPQGYGMGMGGLLGGSGAAAWGKSKLNKSPGETDAADS